jgi:hypothetical protein
VVGSRQHISPINWEDNLIARRITIERSESKRHHPREGNGNDRKKGNSGRNQAMNCGPGSRSCTAIATLPSDRNFSMQFYLVISCVASFAGESAS